MKNKESIDRERVSGALLKDSGRNFWQEIKRIRSNKTCTNRVIDSQADVYNFVGLFTDKHRELYTSVPFNREEMPTITAQVNN